MLGSWSVIRVGLGDPVGRPVWLRVGPLTAAPALPSHRPSVAARSASFAMAHGLTEPKAPNLWAPRLEFKRAPRCGP